MLVNPIVPDILKTKEIPGVLGNLAFPENYVMFCFLFFNTILFVRRRKNQAPGGQGETRV
jgi:hypothetical protein